MASRLARRVGVAHLGASRAVVADRVPADDYPDPSLTRHPVRKKVSTRM